MELRVGTFNILNGSCRWQERMPLMQQTLTEMNCDLVGVQEINKALNSSYLPQENGVYFDAEKPLELYGEPTFHIDGNAIFLKPHLQVKSSEIHHFDTKYRCAGVVHLDISGRPFHFCVAHLDYIDDTVAVNQVKDLLGFLHPYMSEELVLVGDFNFTPYSPAYRLMKEHFRSAFVDVKRHEPVITFPTGLRGPYMDPWSSGTFDYIFLRGRIQALTAELHSKGGNGLWASDHFALAAQLRLSLD